MSRHGLLLLRLFLFAAGVALVVWLVRSAGPGRVLEAMEHAGPWLPLVVLLEALMVRADLAASRALVGAAPGASIPFVTWLRATTLAYASSILLPAGRAAGEATRAATLSPAIGVGRAASACTRLQAAVLFANSAISVLIAAVVVTATQPSVLAWSLLANAAACAGGGTVLVMLLRSDAFKAWLRARFPTLVRARAPDEAPREEAPIARAVFIAALARVVQSAQYGVVVHAVGGPSSARAALDAQGIHLVGAAVGDAVPGQMGATEGAYRLFASVLQMAPSQALSVALVVRAAQLVLASLCLAVGLFASRQLRAVAFR